MGPQRRGRKSIEALPWTSQDAARRKVAMPAKAGIQVNVLNLKMNKPGFPPARK
jgi:hypothetical protein